MNTDQLAKLAVFLLVCWGPVVFCLVVYWRGHRESHRAKVYFARLEQARECAERTGNIDDAKVVLELMQRPPWKQRTQSNDSSTRP